MWKALNSRIQVKIVSADIVALLNMLQNDNINIENVLYISDLEFQITISEKDYKFLQKTCQKQGALCKIVNKKGVFRILKSVWKRPVLVMFLCVLCMLFCYVPSRIFFVSVTGNNTISTNQILEYAEKCGIVFGANRRQVRSEKMKNALLQEIPALQWAGINTSGCTAVISVREKTTQDTKVETKNQVCSIVAARDGIIQNCTVLTGNPLCAVGQAVKAGQTLVSGYIDCGIITKTTKANAEIKALTFREIEVVSPMPNMTRGDQLLKSTVYSIKIGKKQINLYKDSGNYDMSCAKIYEENFLQFPGGFCLPIALVKQTVISYDPIQETTSAAEADNWMLDFAKSYLCSTMIAGEIISEDTQLDKIGDAQYIYGRYACLEMIGRVKYEQTIVKDE